MANWTLATVGTCVLALGAAAASPYASPEPPAPRERSESRGTLSARSASNGSKSAIRPLPAHAPAITAVAARALIEEYCLGCHDRGGAKGERTPQRRHAGIGSAG